MRPTILHIEGRASMTGEPGGKTGLLALLVEQLARNSDVHVLPSRGTSFIVPRGTPWKEALPLSRNSDAI